LGRENGSAKSPVYSRRAALPFELILVTLLSSVEVVLGARGRVGLGQNKDRGGEQGK